MKWKLRSVGAIVAAVSLTAACGSEGPGAGSDSSAPIKVMVISQWDTGFLDLKSLPLIVRNGADALNKSGGLKGRRVEVIECNDKNDPNEAQKCARTAVSEKVTAVVGGFSLFGDRIWPVLSAAKIPWIGQLAIAPQDSVNPLAYGLVGGPLLSFAPGHLAGKECDSTALLITQTGNKLVGKFTSLGIKSNGHEFKTRVEVPATATDLASYVAQVKQSGADCLVAVPTQPQWFQLVPAMKAQGLIGKIKVYAMNPGGLTENVVREFPQETEGWRSIGYFPNVNTSPAWAEYKKLQLGAGTLGKLKSKIGDSSETRSWVGWKVFEKVAQSVDGDVTSQSLVSALDKSCAVNVGDFSPTFNFCKTNTDPALKRVFSTKFSYYIAKDGALNDYQPGFHELGREYEKAAG